MKREIIQTSDGSTSILLPEWNETYHSKFGAIQEAKHVFIKNGLSLFKGQSVSILEIGFGTGLNAFITYLEAKDLEQKIEYTGIEAYPVSEEDASKMNYVSELDAEKDKAVFLKMHQSEWNEKVFLAPNFLLEKQNIKFQEIADENKYDLIYFDAFGYRVQPELWSLEIFQIMFKALKIEGILVTYACRSSIKKAMVEAGFAVEKLAGPPGKREMLRARKLS
ncbi:tRNA U34 5-methylaminomethyl-2-thiouridine-forming methyltransferase MnmC [Flavobacterium endophyticum]|uniref:tRNA U34 5-methylaminomethyl-2-thiouridine-forming methyltransferase MnmC n=1 Tax=Flavobacterium endophyticum TaxID=1540163 RepID=A0A495MI24_9FLAO|nr:tRNA (5-methylaminomethyl-2-thiouridine)(34)-methyltransferase MnmD [Flavobacterium endophyticum]RKS25078.1 tRNA U34 5-methylaminomethyl-2-thiouridine-forming methyltransferase MnmC [Flavobacterium endophyticum]